MKSSAPAEHAPGLNAVLDRNIGALLARRREEEARATLPERVADTISYWAGSMSFAFAHAAAVALWVVWNVGLLGLAPFDPTFVILATVASVEAIFLSTFILISQNRSAAAAERRAELDLHVSLLGEHEITRALQVLTLIAERLNIEVPGDAEMVELQRDIAPEQVLEKIREADASQEPDPPR